MTMFPSGSLVKSKVQEMNEKIKKLNIERCSEDTLKLKVDFDKSLFELIDTIDGRNESLVKTNSVFICSAYLDGLNYGCNNW